MAKTDGMSKKELARYIDCAILKPEMTPEQVIEAAKEGIARCCASVCVNPGFVKVLEPYVEGSETDICPVVDFPFGTSSTASRLSQISDVLDSKAVREIDIVIKYGLLKGGHTGEVLEDLKACVSLCHENGKQLKVIIETDALTKEEIVTACKLCVEAGADFVKTSTGFLTGHELFGAAPETVDLILKTVDGRCKVKGSGAIRNRERFLELINMGVDRLGVNYVSVPKILDTEE